MEIESNLHSIIDDYFSNSDYKVIDTVLRGSGGTTVLEIFVDNKDGINIDELSKISKEINGIVDEKIILNNISSLVVSSPGTDRPVKFAWQLVKHSGRILEIEMNDGEKIEGRLMNEPDERESLMLEIVSKDKKKKGSPEEREINFKDIKELKVKLSFSKK